MPHGKPTAEQIEAIAKHVRGRRVHDLGSGDCILADMLLQLGAAHVTAVDAQCPYPSLGSPIFTPVVTEFRHYKPTEPIDVAFLSWPSQYEELGGRDGGLTDIVELAKTVVYLGSNTDMNACGSERLIEHFLRRDLLLQMPARQNTLLILGDIRATHRPPTGEEYAAWERVLKHRAYSFEEALQISAANYPPQDRAQQ